MARKILLADDSVTAQNMGRKILTDAGYEVITVNNGSAALKKIAEGKPDLIVLDVYMPGYSGLEVCQRIKENRETARIPILLTVGKLEPFKPEEARRARADAFVVKPFEASELLTALTKLEDKIVPGAEPYKPGRFAKAIASVEKDADPNQFGDSDEGWKARLRIPTGTPKPVDTETPVDYAATQGKGFRDIAESPARKSTAKPAAPPVFERPVPTGLPHDITPEEIAAITAAAAQLKGKSPTATPETNVPAAAAEELVAKAASDTPAAESSVEESAPVTFASAPELQSASSVESPAEMPVVEAEVSADASSTFQHQQVEPVAENRTETGVAAEPPSIEVAATSAETSGAHASVPENATAPPQPQPETAVETPAEIVATSVPTDEPAPIQQTEAMAAAPSESATLANSPAATSADDEVMAALHALIPTEATAQEPSVPTNGNGGTALSADSNSASTQVVSAGPRWIAEEVPISTEEATLSLDREMELTLAVAQAAAPDPTPTASETSQAVTVEADPVEQHAPQAFAAANAAGADFTVPWPVGNAVAPQSPNTETGTHPAAEPITEIAEASHPAPEQTHASIENDPLGGTEIMAASWKNIRDSIAGSAAKPAPAKEEFAEAAAPSEGAPADHSTEPARSQGAAPKLAATDPTAIANIVESVLADLRPKIVEEIARKLSDSNK